jgi:SAM-dependent methyltransferase
MSGKHDVLSEEDMRGFRMDREMLALLQTHMAAAARPINTNPPKILDWGCGRGRAVAFLAQAGYCTFGVDADRAVMLNGHPLFIARGLDPHSLLRHTSETGSFPDGYFDAVFSEETIEHVIDLESAAREMFRLVKPGGIVIHSYPGSRWLMEPHVCMPLIHWLPDNGWRRALVTLCLLSGLGPRPHWPEAANADLAGRAAVYCRYIAEKTCYRTKEAVMTIFGKAGFDCRCLAPSPARGWRRLLSVSLRENGFPACRMLLHLTKPAAAHTV